MTRLLHQNWFVVKRNSLLWLICIVMTAAAAGARLTLFGSNITPGLGFVYAFFAAVYISDLGTSGRLDTQIASGFARPQIFAAQLLTLLICYLLILLGTLAGELAAGALRGALAKLNLYGWLASAAGLALNAAGYAGVFTLIGLALAGRQAGRGIYILVAAVCVVFAAAVWGLEIDSRLRVPECDTYLVVDGVPVELYEYLDEVPALASEAGLEGESVIRAIPNPGYVHEPERARLAALGRFLPVTQCAWLVDMQYTELTSERMQQAGWVYLYALVLAAAASGAGILIFRHRQLD